MYSATKGGKLKWGVQLFQLFKLFKSDGQPPLLSPKVVSWSTWGVKLGVHCTWHKKIQCT